MIQCPKFNCQETYASGKAQPPGQIPNAQYCTTDSHGVSKPREGRLAARVEAHLDLGLALVGGSARARGRGLLLAAREFLLLRSPVSTEGIPNEMQRDATFQKILKSGRKQTEYV